MFCGCGTVCGMVGGWAVEEVNGEEWVSGVVGMEGWIWMGG